MVSETVKAHAGAGKEVGEASSCNENDGAITEEESQAQTPVDMIIDIETDDLIFSDDAFPSLPDFPCLTSPSASPSPSSVESTQPKTPCGSTKSSTSSSSSSSSSPWSLLKSPTTSDTMQPLVDKDQLVRTNEPASAFPQESDGFDILETIDLWDPTDPSVSWDSSTFFPDENSGGGASGEQASEEEMVFVKGGECSSEDLANVFLEWLKNNKDSISPEDLRSIKLKRSTIECAALRLGGGKQGRVQLLKLILAWVQNHHLQKKRRRSRGATRGNSTDHCLGGISAAGVPHFYDPNINRPLSPDANTNPNMDLNYEAGPCNPWVTYGVEPSLPSLIPSYGGDALAAPPYQYYHGQTFSPLTAPEILPTAEHVSVAWSQGFSQTSSSVNYSAFGPTPTSPHLHPLPPISMLPPYHVGLSAHLAYSQPFNCPGMGIGSGTSATKEARKRRMARHRRISSMHSLRNQQDHQQQQSLNTAIASDHNTMDVIVGGSSSSVPHANNSRNWGFWSPLPVPSSLQELPPSDFPPLQKLQLSLPPSAIPTDQMKQQNLQQHASTVDKRQGFKSEKNLRFLLQKVLKQSDVGSLGRIVLPKKEAEIHLPELDARDGISIEMEDIANSRVWNMRYRFWPNNKSRMYLLENTGDFVRSNGLQEGDFIVIYSDVKCSKYMIRGVKVRQPIDVKGGSKRNICKAHQKKNSSSLNCKG